MQELLKIQNETIQKMNQDQPKRGRPRKIQETPSFQTQNQPSQTQQFNSPVPTAGLKLTFKSLFTLTGKYLATSFKFPRYELEVHEAEALADQADGLIVEFYPNAQGRWSKLIAFVISLAGIFGMRYFEHAKTVTKNKEEKPENTPVQENNKSNNFGDVIDANPVSKRLF